MRRYGRLRLRERTGPTPVLRIIQSFSLDLTVIRDYLGHASVATTSRYLTTNLKMKQDVLDAFWKRAGLEKQTGPRWRLSPKLLAFLESL